MCGASSAGGAAPAVACLPRAAQICPQQHLYAPPSPLQPAQTAAAQQGAASSLQEGEPGSARGAASFSTQPAAAADALPPAGPYATGQLAVRVMDSCRTLASKTAPGYAEEKVCQAIAFLRYNMRNQDIQSQALPIAASSSSRRSCCGSIHFHRNTVKSGAT